MLRRMADGRYQESDREEEPPGGKTREDMESVGLKVDYVINRRKWKKKIQKTPDHGEATEDAEEESTGLTYLGMFRCSRTAVPSHCVVCLVLSLPLPPILHLCRISSILSLHISLICCTY